MKKNRPDIKYIISDINQEIVELYLKVRDKPRELIDYLDRWQTGYLSKDKEQRKEMYYDSRSLYWGLQRFHDEKSYLLYCLMKTSFNGIWQTCKESYGEFATPFGLGNQIDKIYDKEQIFKWSQILQGVEILCCDFSSLIIPENSLIYLDPPYVDSFTSYGINFDNNEQIRLFTWAKEKAQDNLVFLSNRSTSDDFVKKHFSDSTIHEFPITYTAGRRLNTDEGYKAKKATELLIEI